MLMNFEFPSLQQDHCLEKIFAQDEDPPPISLGVQHQLRQKFTPDTVLVAAFELRGRLGRLIIPHATFDYWVT